MDYFPPTKRVPFSDRTHVDRQFHNAAFTYRPFEPSLAKMKTPIKTLRTYVHNPYEPVVLKDVCDDTASVTSDHSASTVTSGAPTAVSDTRVYYVNGRPVVVPNPTVTDEPNTSIQDISFEGTDMDGTEKASNQAAEEEEINEDDSEDEIVTVAFRLHSGRYLSHTSLRVGDYVVVEGDRGYDVGRAVECAPRSMVAVDAQSPKGESLDWVLRLATEDEIRTLLTEQRAAEDDALERVRAEAKRLNLNMDIQNCEFQYDRQKLSFFFEAREKVMFVPLLKHLHREYGCRIWLQQVNRSDIPSTPSKHATTPYKSRHQ